MTDLTERSILDLLAARHYKDTFVRHAKMGSTWINNDLRILDAWVLKSTWKPPTTIGYEVKVSHSDFLKDEKWPAYREACHLFYFVCPWGLIMPDELSNGVGLIWVSKNGRKLYQKVKPKRNEIEWPGDVMAYVLMSRARVVDDRYGAVERPRTERIGQWRLWVEERQTALEIGRKVRGKIGEAITEVYLENERLLGLMRGYDEIRKRIEELGFDPDQSIGTWAIKSRLEDLAAAIPKGLARRLRRAALNLSDAATLAENIERGKLVDGD